MSAHELNMPGSLIDRKPIVVCAGACKRAIAQPSSVLLIDGSRICTPCFQARLRGVANKSGAK